MQMSHYKCGVQVGRIFVLKLISLWYYFAPKLSNWICHEEFIITLEFRSYVDYVGYGEYYDGPTLAW